MNLQSYCHHAPVTVDLSPDAENMFACSSCLRDQMGFFAFIYAIAQRSGANAVSIATSKKGPKVVRKCGNCGEEGHQARKCPKLAPAEEPAPEAPSVE